MLKATRMDGDIYRAVLDEEIELREEALARLSGDSHD